jgi:hypothetical protein
MPASPGQPFVVQPGTLFVQYKDAAGNYVVNNGNTAGDARTIQRGVRFQF